MSPSEFVEYPSREAMVEGLLQFREEGVPVQTYDGLRVLVIEQPLVAPEPVEETTPADPPAPETPAVEEDLLGVGDETKKE